MIAGKTLVDIKLSQRAEDYLTRWLRQIVGYALADHDDRHGIELVGIYHAAEAWLISWELKDLLEQLSIEPTSVSLMRDRFRVAMDREIARVAERT